MSRCQAFVFLDYLACGKLDADVAAQIVSGVTEGCLQSYAALVGVKPLKCRGFYQPVNMILLDLLWGS